MTSYQYRESHCGDKTVVRSSYLHNCISYTGKMTSLYWIRAQLLICFHQLWISTVLVPVIINAMHLHIFIYHLCLGISHLYFNISISSKPWSILCTHSIISFKRTPFQQQSNNIFSCDQAALWMVQSVRPSVRPSDRHTFFTMFPSSYHHEIFRSYYHWQRTLTWCPCKKVIVRGQSPRSQRSKEILAQFGRLRTVRSLLIHR